MIPNYAQTGLSGAQLKAGLQTFSWRPSCCPGCYAVVATAQGSPAWGRSCQKRVPFLGVLLGEWHHRLSAAHQKPVIPGQVWTSGPSLRRTEMAPYRRMGLEESPEKAQCFPPSKMARRSHRQRCTRRGQAQSETVWVRPPASNLGVQSPFWREMKKATSCARCRSTRSAEPRGGWSVPEWGGLYLQEEP